MYVKLGEVAYAHECSYPMEAKISDLLVQEIVSHSIQVLGPKLRSSARAAS